MNSSILVEHLDSQIRDSGGQFQVFVHHYFFHPVIFGARTVHMINLELTGI